MSLTGAQHGLYNHLFAAVLQVRPEADRLAMHAELGLPESRKDWGNREFDEWKRACLAISQPANLAAQLAGLGGEGIRRRHVIRGLLAKLGAPDAYAESVARQMGFAGTLETYTESQLGKLIAALKLQVRRAKKGKVAKENCPF